MRVVRNLLRNMKNQIAKRKIITVVAIIAAAAIMPRRKERLFLNPLKRTVPKFFTNNPFVPENTP